MRIVRIKSIKSIKPEKVYDFTTVSPNHSFIANGFVTHNCPSETPEGIKVGVVLNLSLTCKISTKIPTILVRNCIEKSKYLISVSDVNICELRNLTSVYINNIIIGFSNAPDSFIEEVRLKRYRGVLDREVSVSYDIVDNEIKIFCEEGRFLRPLISLDNNRIICKPLEKYTWDKLIENKDVQFLDAGEIENSVIAMTQESLAIQNNTYMEIHPVTMLGVLASMIPFPDHNQSPRNCYQCLYVEEQVIMHDYSKKKIKDIKIGDKVITVDPDTHLQDIATVINQFVKETNKKMVKVITFLKEELVCTEDHLLLTINGWKEAGKLTRRDKVSICFPNLSNDGKPDCGMFIRKNYTRFIPVDSVVEHENVMISDITLDKEPHSFITGKGFCVHNSSMGKQALGIPLLSYNSRTDTKLHVLQYPQKPIVSSAPSRFIGIDEMPSGINAIVAVACYTGYNQEDSVMMNQSAIDRGLFCLTSYHTIDACEKKGSTYSTEKICLPPKNSDSTVKIDSSQYFKRKYGNYEYLDENGVIKPRNKNGGAVHVKKGDVLVGKILIISNKAGEELQKDVSVIIQQDQEGIIDRVLALTTPEGHKMVKVVIRVNKQPSLGDKIASRSAQKGTIGMVYQQQDMPFTTSGIVPDIIISPNCLVSRMTISQIIECVVGKECVMSGRYGDATPFGKASVDIADSIVETIRSNITRYGFQSQGWETMYNGFTGEEIKAQIFIGPTYYQRLKHMVDDKIHARARGHVTTLTRQALEGRSRDGGLKFGEMERDCILSHGASRFLKERLYEVSDPFQVVICKSCGVMTLTRTECQVCKGSDLVLCNIPYASKLLTQELASMNLKLLIYPENEE